MQMTISEETLMHKWVKRLKCNDSIAQIALLLGLCVLTYIRHELVSVYLVCAIAT